MAKIGKHIDGTSGTERGCNTDWTLASLEVPDQNVLSIFSRKICLKGIARNFISRIIFNIWRPEKKLRATVLGGEEDVLIRFDMKACGSPISKDRLQKLPFLVDTGYSF